MTYNGWYETKPNQTQPNQEIQKWNFIILSGLKLIL